MMFLIQWIMYIMNITYLTFSAPGGTGWTPRPSQSTPSQQTPNSQNTTGSQVSNTPSSGNVRAQLEDDFDDAEMLEAYSNIEESQTS